MIDWILRNWRGQWLGNFAWWQTIAALFQAAAAIVLFFITRKYVHLTGKLAKSGEQQARLQQQSLKISLFEARLNVYLRTMGFLAEIAKTMRPELKDMTQLLRDTNSAEFIFEQDASDFIQNVYEKAAELRANTLVLDTEPDPNRKQALIAKIEPLEKWLAETAFSEAKRIFHPYLKFRANDLQVPN